MLTIFGWNVEIEERCKGVHCVDLGESFPTSIYLQNSASIQPENEDPQFGGKLFNIIHSCPYSREAQLEAGGRPSCRSGGCSCSSASAADPWAGRCRRALRCLGCLFGAFTTRIGGAGHNFSGSQHAYPLSIHSFATFLKISGQSCTISFRQIL